ncbi:PREDICTED: protein TIFY 6B-like [Camelina sativa]|uniref:Protein TIFY n=1 Tax=Camelina sativa TaxID=90675 RepID=A0ABM0XLF5_CAMSA|nr:PREDICTED: protein TIFY 6B-like [Camelina sativa]
MERDLLGLGSKNSPITVKEETSESSRDSAPNRGGMNWSFSNKVSAASSQFLSFRPSSQEDKHRKSGNYHLPHSGSFMPSSVADVYDSNRKAPYSSVQGVRMFPNSNQQEETNAVSMSMPGFQSHHYAPGGRSFISNSNTSQPLVGVPIMAPPISILPPPGAIVGTTDIRSSSKPIGAPAQLTIFYAGSVCVYDDISPEKAKAIMFLAGNGSPMPQAFSPPQTHHHHHTRASVDSSAMPPSFMPTISYLSPEAVSSTNGLGAAKLTRGLTSRFHDNQNNASNINCSVAVSGSTSVMAPTVALPLARKASLARFLEKRKERVTSVSPYCVDKKSSTDCRRSMSECISSSLSSAT